MRGISVYADTLTETIDGVSLNLLWQEFADAQSLWNSTRSAVAALFTFDTTESNDMLRGEGTASDFEKASEFGAPKTIRFTPDGLRVGFPFQWWDARIAYSKRFLRSATAEQIRAQHTAALEADNHLVFREVMTALTTPILNASRPENQEAVGIYSLYAGELTPPSFLGQTFASSHQHYMVSGAATVDGQDLADLIETIQEHGHGLRASNDRIVIFVHPDEGKVIRGFRAGVAGSPWDFIPSTDAPAYLTDLTVVGDQPSPSFNELTIFGSYGDALLTESYLVPSKYVIAAATGGPGSKRNPLAFREHPRSESQGLLLTPGTERYPLVGSTYERGFGLGVRNMGAAAVMQIKASGSYVAPSFAR
jgi:hypothetical protein